MDANSDSPNKARRRHRYLRRRRRGSRNVQPSQSTSNPETSSSETTSSSSSSSFSTVSSSATTTTITSVPPECNTSTSQTALTDDLTLLPSQQQQLAPSAELTTAGDGALVLGCDNEGGASPPDQTQPTGSQPSTPTTTTTLDHPRNATPSVNAVRVLFRDQQLQVNQASHSTIITTTTTGARLTPPASIVSANRRLIERQLAAVQAADSRRWNFDFRNCRPMDQSGHRYVHCADSAPRNCRPLNDQNQSTATGFRNQQTQQWQLPTTGQGDCQHRSDHKQDDG